MISGFKLNLKFTFREFCQFSLHSGQMRSFGLYTLPPLLLQQYLAWLVIGDVSGVRDSQDVHVYLRRGFVSMHAFIFQFETPLDHPAH